MIRRAIEEDAPNLAALSIQVWLDAYAFEGVNHLASDYVLTRFTSENFEQLIADPERDILLYVESDNLLGYAMVNRHSYFEDQSNGFEVETLYVQPHHKGRGLGRKLIEAIVREIGNPFWLSTWVGNQNAIAFYRHMGFKKIGTTYFPLGQEQHENDVLRFG